MKGSNDVFSDNPSYMEYETLLIDLNRLMADEQDEGTEAEVIRDRLEQLHRTLSPAERQRLRELSADLYMLQDDEINEPLEAGQTAESLENDVRDAWERQKMENLLSLLRKAPTFLNREAVASLRSYAYQHLGDLPAALEFKQLAAALNPAEVGHRLTLAELLWRLGRYEEAADQARAVIASHAATPEMAALAGYFLWKASDLPDAEDAVASLSGSQVETLLTAA
jgi:hypothetical protein